MNLADLKLARAVRPRGVAPMTEEQLADLARRLIALTQAGNTTAAVAVLEQAAGINDE